MWRVAIMKSRVYRMKIETWSRLPRAVRDHLVERMHDATLASKTSTSCDFGESKPDVPDKPWYKEFWLVHALRRRQVPQDVSSFGPIGQRGKALALAPPIRNRNRTE
jgi:hypothetical protein